MLPVVEDGGGEGEQAAGDAADEAGEGAAAVAFERELVFERVEGRFDPLADAAERAEAWLFVFAVGAQQPAAERGDVLLELGAGEAFVGDHDLAAAASTRSSISAATTRSGAFAGASSNPTGSPSGEQSR